MSLQPLLQKNYFILSSMILVILVFPQLQLEVGGGGGITVTPDLAGVGKRPMVVGFMVMTVPRNAGRKSIFIWLDVSDPRRF